MSSVDTKVAEVTVTGEDAQAVEKHAEAQFATAEGEIGDGGERFPLENCLFTFEKVEGQENIYIQCRQKPERKLYM